MSGVNFDKSSNAKNFRNFSNGTSIGGVHGQIINNDNVTDHHFIRSNSISVFAGKAGNFVNNNLCNYASSNSSDKNSHYNNGFLDIPHNSAFGDANVAKGVFFLQKNSNISSLNPQYGMNNGNTRSLNPIQRSNFAVRNPPANNTTESYVRNRNIGESDNFRAPGFESFGAASRGSMNSDHRSENVSDSYRQNQGLHSYTRVFFKEKSSYEYEYSEMDVTRSVADIDPMNYGSAESSFFDSTKVVLDKRKASDGAIDRRNIAAANVLRKANIFDPFSQSSPRRYTHGQVGKSSTALKSSTGNLTSSNNVSDKNTFPHFDSFANDGKGNFSNHQINGEELGPIHMAFSLPNFDSKQSNETVESIRQFSSTVPGNQGKQYGFLRIDLPTNSEAIDAPLQSGNTEGNLDKNGRGSNEFHILTASSQNNIIPHLDHNTGGGHQTLDSFKKRSGELDISNIESFEKEYEPVFSYRAEGNTESHYMFSNIGDINEPENGLRDSSTQNASDKLQSIPATTNMSGNSVDIDITISARDSGVGNVAPLVHDSTEIEHSQELHLSCPRETSDLFETGFLSSDHILNTSCNENRSLNQDKSSQSFDDCTKFGTDKTPERRDLLPYDEIIYSSDNSKKNEYRNVLLEYNEISTSGQSKCSNERDLETGTLSIDRTDIKMIHDNKMNIKEDLVQSLQTKDSNKADHSDIMHIFTCSDSSKEKNCESMSFNALTHDQDSSSIQAANLDLPNEFNDFMPNSDPTRAVSKSGDRVEASSPVNLDDKVQSIPILANTEPSLSCSLTEDFSLLKDVKLDVSISGVQGNLATVHSDTLELSAVICYHSQFFNDDALDDDGTKENPAVIDILSTDTTGNNAEVLHGDLSPNYSKNSLERNESTQTKKKNFLIRSRSIDAKSIDNDIIMADIEGILNETEINKNDGSRHGLPVPNPCSSVGKSGKFHYTRLSTSSSENLRTNTAIYSQPATPIFSLSRLSSGKVTNEEKSPLTPRGKIDCGNAIEQINMHLQNDMVKEEDNYHSNDPFMHNDTNVSEMIVSESRLTALKDKDEALPSCPSGVSESINSNPCYDYVHPSAFHEGERDSVYVNLPNDNMLASAHTHHNPECHERKSLSSSDQVCRENHRHVMEYDKQFSLDVTEDNRDVIVKSGDDLSQSISRIPLSLDDNDHSPSSKFKITVSRSSPKSHDVLAFSPTVDERNSDSILSILAESSNDNLIRSIGCIPSFREKDIPFSPRNNNKSTEIELCDKHNTDAQTSLEIINDGMIENNSSRVLENEGVSYVTSLVSSTDFLEEINKENAVEVSRTDSHNEHDTEVTVKGPFTGFNKTEDDNPSRSDEGLNKTESVKPDSSAMNLVHSIPEDSTVSTSMSNDLNDFNGAIGGHLDTQLDGRHSTDLLLVHNEPHENNTLSYDQSLGNDHCSSYSPEGTHHALCNNDVENSQCQTDDILHSRDETENQEGSSRQIHQLPPLDYPINDDVDMNFTQVNARGMVPTIEVEDSIDNLQNEDNFVPDVHSQVNFQCDQPTPKQLNILKDNSNLRMVKLEELPRKSFFSVALSCVLFVLRPCGHAEVLIEDTYNQQESPEVIIP